MSLKKNKTSNPKHKILRFLFVLCFLAILFVFAVYLVKKTGLWDKINSIQKIRALVESGGVFSFLLFFILQVLQTTILQIPAVLLTAAGALVFGSWKAFLLSYSAVMLGSVIMFWLGRKAGRKFLNWIVGKDNLDMWIEKLSHGKYLFFLMMIFPLFPDDILCAVAGLTNMSFSFFFWTNVIARGIGIGCTVFFADGTIIPFTGWGLVVWAIVGIVIVTLFYLSIKYQDKLDEILKQFSKKSEK